MAQALAGFLSDISVLSLSVPPHSVFYLANAIALAGLVTPPHLKLANKKNTYLYI